MPTPHIESKKEDIAKVVLMPGDPKRAKYIADNYLDNVKLVNSIRGMTAYTGYYKDNLITVFPSGMGIPSVGIYSYELFTEYDVEKIIRIGTFGAYIPELNLGDIVLVDKSVSDSSYARFQNGYDKNYILSDLNINSVIEDVAKKLDIKIKKGSIYSTDVFYEKESKWKERVDEYGVMGVEMETFGLFHNAIVTNKKATALLTVSDSFCTNAELTSEERQNNLDEMIKLALNASLKL